MSVMKGDEYVKYLAERMMSYMEMPREERKLQRKRAREPWTSRWFGMLPLGLNLWLGERKRKKHHKLHARTTGATGEKR